MRLRKRFADEMTARCNRLLPGVGATVWDVSGVLVVVESLKFMIGSGECGDWNETACFEGVIRVELNADKIDALDVEPLIGDLVDTPMVLAASSPEETPAGDTTENARAVLIEWRDSVRDQQVVSMLRFDVIGTLRARLLEIPAPELLVGTHPDVGEGNEDSYLPASEGLG